MSDSNDRLLLINESILTDIADAIRTKTGKSQKIYPSNMDEEILSISAGGTTPTGSINITTNGTHDVTNYATAVVAVSSGQSEAHPPITINITQSDHQTISVSKSMTPVTSNNQVSVPSTVTLRATITPAPGYDAGTLNQTQVTAHWGDTVSFSATPATAKILGNLIFEVGSLDNTEIGEGINFYVYVYAEQGEYVYYENGKYFDIYINGDIYEDDNFHILEIDGDTYYDDWCAYHSIYVSAHGTITETDIKRGYILVEIKDRSDNTVVLSEHLEVAAVNAYLETYSINVDESQYGSGCYIEIRNSGNVTLYDINAYFDNNLLPCNYDYSSLSPGDDEYWYMVQYPDLFSTLGKGDHTCYFRASTVENSGVYDATISSDQDFYLSPIDFSGNIYSNYSDIYVGDDFVIEFSNDSSYYPLTGSMYFTHPITGNQITSEFIKQGSTYTCTFTISDLPADSYSIEFNYDGNKWWDSYSDTISFDVTTP